MPRPRHTVPFAKVPVGACFVEHVPGGYGVTQQGVVLRKVDRAHAVHARRRTSRRIPIRALELPVRLRACPVR